MKKSSGIVLSAVMAAAISSCGGHKDEWTDGKDVAGHTRDTSIYRNGSYHYYRYYGGGWYILHANNMINTSRYEPASASEIASPTYTPRPSSGSHSSSRSASGNVHQGGFGSSAHSSGGE